MLIFFVSVVNGVKPFIISRIFLRVLLYFFSLVFFLHLYPFMFQWNTGLKKKTYDESLMSCSAMNQQFQMTDIILADEND